MELIQDFNTLSVEEQKAFAVNLVAKVNELKPFLKDIAFNIEETEADSLSGDLYINVTYSEGGDAEYLTIEREASWDCNEWSDPEDEQLYVTPNNYDNTIEFENDLKTDILKAFKATETIIDGYKVNISVDDCYGGTIVDVVDVKKWHHDDAGIGWYDYGDGRFLDSHPYVEIDDGILAQECEVYLSLVVSPAN